MFDTPTQLEDISNKVSQEKIGDRRLRNEEIRRQMGKEWTAPTSASAGSQPKSLQDIYSNDGNSPTEASTYSRLKGNSDFLGLTGSGGGSNTASNSAGSASTSTGIPSWAPRAVGLGMSVGGLGEYAGLGQAATNLARGNTGAGLGGLASWASSQTPLGKISGASGLIGTTVNGLVNGDSWNKMATDAAFGLGKAALGKAVPGLGLADLLMGLGTWGVGALTGKDMNWNPQRGLSNLFGDGLVGVAPGFEGYGGGFFGPNALGDGISNGSGGGTNSGGGGWLGGGQNLNTNSTPTEGAGSGYTPPNYSLGQGVSLGGYSPSPSSGDSGGDE